MAVGSVAALTGGKRATPRPARSSQQCELLGTERVRAGSAATARRHEVSRIDVLAADEAAVVDCCCLWMPRHGTPFATYGVCPPRMRQGVRDPRRAGWIWLSKQITIGWGLTGTAAVVGELVLIRGTVCVQSTSSRTEGNATKRGTP